MAIENNTVVKPIEETPKVEPIVDNKTEVVKAPTKTDLLKEISKEFGINAFEPTEVKAEFEKLKAWQDSQKTEQEKLQEQVDLFEKNELDYKKKLLEYESKLEASKLGIHSDNLEDVLKLAGGDPTKIAEVVKKYPTFLSKEGVVIGLQNPNNNKQPTGMTEVEAYKAANPHIYGRKK